MRIDFIENDLIDVLCNEFITIKLHGRELVIEANKKGLILLARYITLELVQNNDCDWIDKHFYYTDNNAYISISTASLPLCISKIKEDSFPGFFQAKYPNYLNDNESFESFGFIDLFTINEDEALNPVLICPGSQLTVVMLENENNQQQPIVQIIGNKNGLKTFCKLLLTLALNDTFVKEIYLHSNSGVNCPDINKLYVDILTISCL